MDTLLAPYVGQLFEHAPVPTAILDSHCRIRTANAAFADLLGYPRAKLIGLSVEQITAPDDVPHTLARVLEAATRPGRRFSYEKRYVRPDGSHIWVAATIAGVKLANETVVVGHLRDLSAERRQDAETQTAAEQRQRLAAIVEGSSDAIVATSTRGVITAWNAAAEAMFGYSASEAVGQPVEMLIAPDRRGEVPGQIARVLAGDFLRNVETVDVRKDGSRLEVSLTLSPIRNAHGQIAGISAIVHDLSERRRAQRDGVLLRELVEQSSDPIEVVDAQTLRFLDVNQAACQELGYTREELRGMTVADIDPLLATEPMRAMRAQLEARGQASCESLHRRKDGSTFPVRVTVKRLRLERPLNLVTTHDLTQQKAREARLARADRALRTQSAGNAAIVHATTEEALYQRMCEICVETGGYRLAWVGIAQNDDHSSVRIAAHAGDDHGVLGTLRLSWADGPGCLGPAGRCIQTGQPQVVNDLFADDTLTAWHEAAARLGIQSRVALPLARNFETFGVLVVDAGEADAFDAEELALLSETARTLSYGVDALRARADNIRSLLGLQRSMETTVRALASTAAARDPYTAGHQDRVSALAVAIATELGLSAERIHGVSLAAGIHDIGKVCVPAEILARPGKLQPLEYELIKRHAQVGHEILKDIHFPWPVAEIVHQHHERLDGSGYPRGLSGSAILLEAQIVAIADVVEAIAAHRPYRPGRGIAVALEHISQGRGSKYDAQAVDACLRLFQEKGFELPQPWAASAAKHDAAPGAPVPAVAA